jgi:hypothetical protein
MTIDDAALGDAAFVARLADFQSAVATSTAIRKQSDEMGERFQEVMNALASKQRVATDSAFAVFSSRLAMRGIRDPLA